MNAAVETKPDPNRHSYWIRQVDKKYEECSYCHCRVSFWYMSHPNDFPFCPNCQSIMDGKTKYRTTSMEYGTLGLLDSDNIPVINETELNNLAKDLFKEENKNGRT